MAHYLGDSGLSARVVISTSSPGQIYGLMLREPVLKIINDFTHDFKASGQDLAQFLTEHPEWKERVNLLKKYSKAQD